MKEIFAFNFTFARCGWVLNGLFTRNVTVCVGIKLTVKVQYGVNGSEHFDR